MFLQKDGDVLKKDDNAFLKRRYYLLCGFINLVINPLYPSFFPLFSPFSPIFCGKNYVVKIRGFVTFRYICFIFKIDSYENTSFCLPLLSFQYDYYADRQDEQGKVFVFTGQIHSIQGYYTVIVRV